MDLPKPDDDTEIPETLPESLPQQVLRQHGLPNPKDEVGEPAAINMRDETPAAMET